MCTNWVGVSVGVANSCVSVAVKNRRVLQVYIWRIFRREEFKNHHLENNNAWIDHTPSHMTPILCSFTLKSHSYVALVLGIEIPTLTNYTPLVQVSLQESR